MGSEMCIRDSAKTSHPSFDLWKEMSEKSDDNWPTVKKDFLTQAGKLPVDIKSANKFQVQQGQVQENENEEQRTEVVDKANRIKEGHRFKG